MARLLFLRNETHLENLSLFNFGGGTNLWFSRHVGAKIEFRDHVHSGSGSTVHYAEFMLGIAVDGHAAPTRIRTDLDNSRDGRSKNRSAVWNFRVFSSSIFREGNMRTLLCFLMMAAFAGVALADVSVPGKWSGTFNPTDANGETKESTALLVLKQSGSDITGTVGPNEDEQFAIQKGKIEGDKITLVVDHDGSTMTFNLLLAADRITGEAQMSRDGETRKAKIDVSRAK